MDQLAIQIDVAQSRLKAKPVFTLVDRDFWDLSKFTSGVCTDPLFGMAFLRPRCWERSWYTSTTSPYDKYGESSFTGLTGAKWYEHDMTGVGGGLFLTTSDSSANSETATTSAMIGQNRAVVFSFMAYGEGSDVELYRIGYTTGSSNISTGTAFKIYSSGVIEPYRNGVMVGRSGEFNITSKTGDKTNVAGKMVEVWIIPCRKNGVMILSNQGGAFFVPFDGINLHDASPEIIPDSYFWVQAQGATPNWQFAPMKFNTSGTIYGQPTKFKRAPSTGVAAFEFMDEASVSFNPVFTTVTNALIYGYKPVSMPTTATVTLRNLADGADFTPNGTDVDVLLKLALASGTGTHTPFIYGALAGYKAELASTPNNPVDLDDYLRSASLSVPEDPERTELSIELKSPAAIEADGATALRTISNRPVNVSIGGTIIDGRSCDHEWDESQQDETRKFRMNVRDTYKYWERLLIDDPIPLDGLKYTNALKFLIRYSGKEEAFWTASGVSLIEDNPATISDTPGDGWNLQVLEGDTVAKWLREVMDTFAPTWFYGIKPMDDSGTLAPRFFAASPEELATTPKAQLFPSIDDADTWLQAEGYTAEDAVRLRRFYVYRAFGEAIMEPEANELFVSGRTPNGDKIVEVRRDDDAIDPASTSRPDNWIGEVVTIGYMDESLSDDDALQNAANYLEEKTFSIRRLPNWESEFQMYRSAGGLSVPVWRGDTVILHDVAGVTGETVYQIRSFDGDFILEPDDDDYEDGQHRPFRYSGEEYIEA